MQAANTCRSPAKLSRLQGWRRLADDLLETGVERFHRLHMLFFISRSLPMTSIGFVLPVTSCIAGSYSECQTCQPITVGEGSLTSTLINALYCCHSQSKGLQARCSDAITFSFPIVKLPCVCSLFSANACSFLTGSVGDTFTRNLTFCFVYSWPG